MSGSSSNGEETYYQLTRIGSPASIGGVADVFKLKEDVTVVGRAKKNVQFFIDSSKHKGLISRIHARIFKSKTQTGQAMFKICDTSLNGTFVNDVKILNESSLKPGDTVAFGHLQGAALQAGNRYSQPDSEFRFKFEISSEAQFLENKLLNGLLTDCGYIENSELEATDFTNFETPTELFIPAGNAEQGSSRPTCTTKRKLVKSFNCASRDDESETDYKLLQEYALAASTAMQSDSDEDLFSIKYASILPGGVTYTMENNQIHKGPERKRQKRKVKRTKPTRSSKNSSSDCVDDCSAMKCLQPNENVIPWVQCDDCDKWYHVKCAGLSLKLVKPKNAKFHCGCT